MYEGMFTQPGSDGIFGGDGVPEDASSPSVDSDGEPLRETLIVSYPSPGHMRVARATLDRRTGQVERHEQDREPAPDEVALLRQRGVAVGPGSIVRQPANLGEVSLPGPRLPALPGDVTRPGLPPLPAGGVVPVPEKKPRTWLKVGVALVVGAAGFWAVNKWVVPMVKGEGETKRKRRAPAKDEAE